jgi:hypothetical protein
MKVTLVHRRIAIAIVVDNITLPLLYWLVQVDRIYLIPMRKTLYMVASLNVVGVTGCP